MIRALIAVVVTLLLAPASAAADDLAVGLYAPSAPFAGTSARLDYVTRLAVHLADAAGATPVARVYARASDLAAAVKKGDVDVAVVDAAYLASIGSPYTVLASATVGGATEASWQLISRGGEDTILALQGKTLLCPVIGGRETDFVHNALLGGELARTFFSGLDTSPDLVSTLAALGLGRGDAAVVPVGVDLPSGATRVATLPSVRWPVLVGFASAGEARRKQVTAAALSFAGGDVLDGFVAGGGAAIRSLAQRFGKPTRRGPMALPNLRVTVDELVEARRPVIERLDLLRLAAPPAALPAPGGS